MVAGQREEVEIVPEMGESRFVPDFCQSGGSLPTESMRSGEVLNVGRNMIMNGGHVSQSGGSSRTESRRVGKESIVRRNGAHGMRLRKRVERSYME